MNLAMSCVSSLNFAVPVNGSPAKFFKASRDLREDYPLPLFLFLLIAESLSRLLHQARSEGSIKGVKVTDHVVLTHLLFVNDVLLFSESTVQEWRTFKSLLNLFYSTTGMAVSIDKSLIGSNELQREVET